MSLFCTSSMRVNQPHWVRRSWETQRVGNQDVKMCKKNNHRPNPAQTSSPHFRIMFTQPDISNLHQGIKYSHASRDWEHATGPKCKRFLITNHREVSTCTKTNVYRLRYRFYFWWMRACGKRVPDSMQKAECTSQLGIIFVFNLRRVAKIWFNFMKWHVWGGKTDRQGWAGPAFNLKWIIYTYLRSTYKRTTVSVGSSVDQNFLILMFQYI